MDPINRLIKRHPRCNIPCQRKLVVRKTPVPVGISSVTLTLHIAVDFPIKHSELHRNIQNTPPPYHRQIVAHWRIVRTRSRGLNCVWARPAWWCSTRPCGPNKWISVLGKIRTCVNVVPAGERTSRTEVKHGERSNPKSRTPHIYTYARTRAQLL
jgi:hypothetical protein